MIIKYIKIYQSPIAPNDWQIAVVAENERVVKGVCVPKEKIEEEVKKLLPLVAQAGEKIQKDNASKLSDENWLKSEIERLEGRSSRGHACNSDRSE